MRSPEGLPQRLLRLAEATSEPAGGGEPPAHRTHPRRAWVDPWDLYGAPRIYRELRDAGERYGRHRIARIMRAEGLRGRCKQRFRWAQTRRSERPAAPDHVQRNFTASKPNEVWVGDVTMIRTKEGPLYLAAILDLYSRKVVGWATAQHARYQLAGEALEMALRQRRPAPGLIHHTDRGAQYSAFEYQSHLEERRLT